MAPVAAPKLVCGRVSAGPSRKARKSPATGTKRTDTQMRDPFVIPPADEPDQCRTGARSRDTPSRVQSAMKVLFTIHLTPIKVIPMHGPRRRIRNDRKEACMSSHAANIDKESLSLREEKKEKKK